MKIVINAYVTPENLWEAGKAAGLTDEACDYFRHAEEYQIELHVDAENGAVCGAVLLSKFD